MADRRIERNAMAILLTALVILAILITTSLAFSSEPGVDQELTPRPTQPTPALPTIPGDG